jgi:single-strand DNA-binding protein
MNALKNRVQLIGNLGMNPEVRTTESGRKMARMSIATHENYKSASGEWVKETQWHNLIAWGKVADAAEKKLQKGLEVMVEGKLVHREYTDKTGVKRNITEVQVMDMLLFEKAKTA